MILISDSLSKILKKVTKKVHFSIDIMKLIKYIYAQTGHKSLSAVRVCMVLPQDHENGRPQSKPAAGKERLGQERAD
jgi:hypothetical protein